ncbi:unnamed protein product, partial [Closterium sp. NIES-54]
MSSQHLVLGLPRVLPSLPPSLAPPCSPCVEGRLRATPHSSLRPATEPFETLHLDVWGPASRPDPERESFFLVVVDDYSRYTTVSPLAKKSDVTSTLIRWLLTTADTRGRRVSCLHSDCGEPGTDPVTSGGARSGGGATVSLESGPGATTTPDTTPPPHPYPTRHQARVRRAREEQLELEREERELERQQLELQQMEEQQQQPEQEQPQQQQPPPPPVSGLQTLGPPSPSPPSPPFLPSLVLRFLLLTPPQLFSLLLCPRCPLLFLTLGLRVALLVLVPRPLFPSLTFVLPCFVLFASTCCLDYATSLVAAPPTSPLAVG